jgi:FkbM family methyltransferase
MTSKVPQMLRGLFKAAVSLYTSPLRMNDRVRYYVKGIFFTTCYDHLYRTVRYIRSHEPGSHESIIVDVGASDGGTAAYLRKGFPAHRIVAFEPNPDRAQQLVASAGSIGNILCRNIALGSIKRTDTLHITENELSSSLNPLNEKEFLCLPYSAQQQLRIKQHIQVEVSTLDDELKGFSNILLMKLDTQGTELDILRAGVNVLARTRFVLTEMNNHGIYANTCQYYEVDAFLRSQAFRLVDVIVSYHSANGTQEYDALYERSPQPGRG